ncbi:MAG: response regulator [Candidatus Methylomirabilales bacterium]
MGLRILVADDEPYVVLAVRDVLRDLEAEVLDAADGEQALELARTERPDLVLLDVRMPGLDGFQVAAALKGDPGTADIPVVFFTAAAGTSDKVRGLELAEDYLAKPIEAEELKARVRKILRRSGRQPRPLTHGSLAQVPLAGLIRSLESARQTVRLLLARGDEQGEILFAGGAIVQAAQGARRGESAVYHLLTWVDGDFTTVRVEGEVDRAEVHTPVPALLAEAQRRLEELPALRSRLSITARAPLAIPPVVQESLAGRVPPSTAALAALLDGTRPFDLVLRESPLDAWGTLRLLVSLAAMGALSSAEAGSERRTGLRFKVRLPIEYQSAGLWQESGTFNLSAWGVFIRTAVPFDAGAQVLLRFHLPGRSAPVVVSGRVVWGNPDPSRWGGMGMGIQFTDLCDADREAIERYLAQLVAVHFAKNEEPEQD